LSENIKKKEELQKKILELKKKRNAAIIVHNYQRDEIQDIADISGDSLALSQAVVRTDADVIVFCGVRFMAESASILNPQRKVLLPVKEAGCPLAEMITIEGLREKKKEHPGAAVVCYVNSSAAVKAESDICCTSSNAIGVVKSLKEKKIIFVPDENLGRYVQSQVPEKEFILWKGFCPTHVRLTPEEVKQVKKLLTNAEFIAHPECRKEVLELADAVCSTGGMFTHVKKSKSKEFIIGTECGMLYKLRKDNPDKVFHMPSARLVCPTMKMTTLERVYDALNEMKYEVKVPEDIRKKAYKSLERMLKISQEPKWSAVADH
jgi:quinolinate synthase